MERRLRKEKHRLRAFTMGMYYFNNNNTARASIAGAKQVFKWGNRSWTEKEQNGLEASLIDEIYKVMKHKYEDMLINNKISLFDIEEEFEMEDECPALLVMLMELLNSWYLIYKPQVEPKDELAVLASDTQNVHTGAVNKQTRTSMDLMIAATVPKGQKTLDEILTAWVMDLKMGATMSEVYKDMLYWADKKMIIQEGDYLYRRALRGLWAKIKSYDYEIRTELTKRLWEECNESVGMCAQGHLSRLANVLVGFDMAFKSPQSLKESLQAALAYISTLDEPVESKIVKATQVMDELDLPQEERQVWLDAF
jgi:hypothetical protein